MMRLLIDTYDYPRKGHPRYIFVQQLVEALVNTGVDVTVVAPQSITHKLFRREKLFPIIEKVMTKREKDYVVYRPLDITFGNRYKFLTKYSRIIRDWQVKYIIRKVKPQVLYGHFWSSALQLKEFAVKYDLPLYVACGEGDNALEILNEQLNESQKSNIRKQITGVISVSSENKRKCIEYHLADEENIIVLPNCVDDQLFHPMSKESCRNKLCIDLEDFVVLFVGVFNSRKGANRVSEALSLLKDNSIKSIFVGKAMSSDVALPFGNNIIFQGEIEHEDLPLYYNAADVFILPTQKEGCCNAIVESLACGIPVISSNRAFNKDILNSENSIMLDPDNVIEIANAIFTLKNNRDLLEKIRAFAVLESNKYSITERANKVFNFISNY